MTRIFAKRGTQICSDLGGLAQILFVWLWMDVGLWVNGNRESKIDGVNFTNFANFFFGKRKRLLGGAKRNRNVYRLHFFSGWMVDSFLVVGYCAALRAGYL